MRRALYATGLVLAVAAGVAALAAARVQPGRPATGNVRDHGAKGDGAADDTAALQDAVDRVAGSVVLPPGTYRITRPIVVELDKVGFASITGGGSARVVMAGAGPAFRFVGTHAGTAAPASVKENVWKRQTMPCLDGLEIVGDHPEADGVEASGTHMLTVTRLLVTKCRHGVRLTGRNRNLTLSDSHVYHNRGIGVFFDGVNHHQANVTGCHVSYNLGGGIVVRAGEVRNLQITGCDVEANHDKDGPPTANVLIDSTGGSNAEVAVTGCTVQHTRNAPGSANIRVKGPSTPDKGTNEVRDGHVTLTGNVLSDTKVNVHLDHARGVVITGNTFWTGVEYNLLAEGSTSVVVGPNNLDRNPRYHREEDGSANAVLFRDCSECTVSGLLVRGTRTAPAGVAVVKCDRMHLTGLTVLDCDNGGLLLDGLTRSRVAGCVVRDDRPGAGPPLRVAGGSGNTVADNTVFPAN
jgi:hypothetical protein